MTSTPFVKLREPGESITLAVQECKKLETGKFPGVGFIGSDGNGRVVVEVPEGSADRQLSRLGHTRESIVGRSVTISRADNPNDASKPYWNIALANGVHPAPKAQAQTQAPEIGSIPGLDDDDMPPPVEEAYATDVRAQQRHPHAFAPMPIEESTTDKLNALFNLYDACFDHAAHLAQRYAKLNPDVAAMGATIFIQANQRGLHV